MSLNFRAQVLSETELFHASIQYLLVGLIPTFPGFYTAFFFQFTQGLSKSHDAKCRG